MPVQYQPFNTSQDVTTTKTLLHEVIPITGSILSGTYSDENIKNYTILSLYLITCCIY